MPEGLSKCTGYFRGYVLVWEFGTKLCTMSPDSDETCGWYLRVEPPSLCTKVPLYLPRRHCHRRSSPDGEIWRVLAAVHLYPRQEIPPQGHHSGQNDGQEVDWAQPRRGPPQGLLLPPRTPLQGTTTVKWAYCSASSSSRSFSSSSLASMTSTVPTSASPASPASPPWTPPQAQPRRWA